jgi:glycosyltransferase involved in cell wall biosynthesis
MPKRRLKVFVDAEVLVVPHFSGIGHYTVELLGALDALVEGRDDVTVELGVFVKQRKKLRGHGFRNLKVRTSPIPVQVSQRLKMRNLQFPLDLVFGKRVYFFPNFTSWPTLFSQSVSVVYDLSFEFFPQFAEPANRAFLSSQVRKTVSRSAAVVTISQNSQREIHEFYGVPLERVPIIHPGVDQSQFFRWPAPAVEEVKRRYGIRGKYILFVGNLEPRKNLKNLLLAYESLDPETRQEYSLLLVGARGWLDEEIVATIERLRTAGNLVQQPDGYVSDADRPALYSGASLFVYPSLYEGFGIPPVEAMACGVPTITSDNSSLPEAVGDAALTIDANSVEELTSAMRTVLGDPDLQEEMVRKGFAQADRFSWQRGAQQLLDIFLEVGTQ